MMIKHRSRLALWLILCFGIVTGMGITQDSPLTPPRSYSGLDIVFLVDQSGSMGGQAFGFSDGGAGNDPLGLRFEAVQYALDTLGQYRLTLASDVPMRMAVVNFGDSADPDDLRRGWVEIAPTPDQTTWDAARAALQDEFSADRFRSRNTPANLGNTNFLAAFESAQTLFASLPPSDPPTLRAIVLLTDGAPCAPAVFDCENLTEQERFFDRLAAQIAGSMPTDGYRIYVLALDDSGGLWGRWRTRWEGITGTPDRSVRVETSQQVGVEFLNILVELMGEVRGGASQDIARLDTGENLVILPPYLREVRVSIFKSTTSPGVLAVRQPDGSALDDNSPALTITNRDRPIEVWSIRDPQPGEWTFTVGDSNDRLDVYLDLIPVEVQATFSGGTFVAGDDVEVVLTLADSSGAPLPDYGGAYTPRANLTLTAPDGAASVIPLARAPDGSYHTSVPSAQAGTYQIGLEVTTQTPDNRLYTLFSRPDFDQFTVRGVAFAVILPDPPTFLVGQRLSLSATLTDDSGLPLTFPQIDVVANLTLDATTTTYPLAASGADGTYTTTIPLDVAGTFVLTVSAQATRSDGQTVPLALPFTAQVAVQQSQFISLRRIDPLESTFTQEVTTGFPPLTPNPLTLTFEVLADGTPTPLTDLSGQVEWSLAVVQDGQPITLDVPAVIQSIEGQAGGYRVSLPDLGTGDFAITVGLDGELSGTYVYDPAASMLEYRVTRTTNPLYVAWMVGLLVVSLVVVTGLVLWVTRRKQQRKHPARGRLVIRREGDEDGATHWEKPLDGLRSNYLIFSDAKLKKAGVTKLIVTCTDAKMSQAKRVKVTAYRGKEVLFRDRPLSPGAPPLRLTKSKGGAFNFGEENTGSSGEPIYVLLKDPDEGFALDL